MLIRSHEPLNWPKKATLPHSKIKWFLSKFVSQKSARQRLGVVRGWADQSLRILHD